METTRLIIRNAALKDIQDIYEMRSSEFVLQYNMMGDTNYENTSAIVAKHIQSDNVFYLELKDSKKVIGEITLEGDSLRYGVNALSISYYLNEKYAQLGYMKEALKVMIDYVFIQLKVEVLSARVFAGNQSSANLLRSLGFVQEGYLRHCVKGYRDVVHDDYLFSKLKSEYEKQNLR